MKKRLLSMPCFYNLVQLVIAAPMIKKMKDRLDESGVTTNPNIRILDVGCGPGEYSQWYSGEYTGIDIADQYVMRASGKYPSSYFIKCDASNFELHEKFDVGVSIGLYHHLSDNEALKSIEVVLRHLRPKSKFYVFDAILPLTFLKNPIGYILRKLDRGKFVRTYGAYKKLLVSLGDCVSYCESDRGGFLDFIVYVVEKK